MLVKVYYACSAFRFCRYHHLLDNLVNRIGTTLYCPRERVTTKCAEAYTAHNGFVAQTLRHTVVIYKNQIAVNIDHRSLGGEVERNNRYILVADILPNIYLCPIAQRKDTDALVLGNAGVVYIP